MSFVGVVLPLVGGFLGEWSQILWGIMIAFLFAFLGALLLRSWWALLIVPVMASVGMHVEISVLEPFMQGGWPDVQAWSASSFSGVDLGAEGIAILSFWILPLFVTAGIGTIIGKQLQMRLWTGYA